MDYKIEMIQRGLKSIALFYAAIAISAWGGECNVDPTKGIPLFLKIITYDDNFCSSLCIADYFWTLFKLYIKI